MGDVVDAASFRWGLSLVVKSASSKSQLRVLKKEVLRPLISASSSIVTPLAAAHPPEDLCSWFTEPIKSKKHSEKHALENKDAKEQSSDFTSLPITRLSRVNFFVYSDLFLVC